MKHYNSIAAQTLPVTGILTNALADVMAMYIKAREIPWTVTGNSFLELENMLEDRSIKLEEAIEEIAVRKNNSGSPVSGTLESFLQYASLNVAMARCDDNYSIMKELLTDHDIIIKGLQKNIDDCYKKHEDRSTADFLKKQIGKQEAIAYKLRMCLNNEEKTLFTR